ncbi:MAG: CinA family nicotinamide mononucleotide deamidase-related protein [Verrucomicrobiota bacterium]
MKLEVICIGDELLIGHTVNTNLAYIGDQIVEIGHRIARETCIPDTLAGISAAVCEAASRADVVITVGGLGPTSDDMTRDAVASALRLELEYRVEAHEAIRSWLGDRSVRVPDEAMRRQARVPRGGELLANTNGTAPGLWIDSGASIVICLPGPPSELRPMLNNEVIPRLKQRFPPSVLIRTIATAGIPESVLSRQLEAELGDRHPLVQPAYCAGPNRVDVRLTAAVEHALQLDKAEAVARQVLADGALAGGARNLPEALAAMLRDRSLTLAVAESCTGGAISKAVTDVPGASEYFLGGLVTYTNAWKQAWLHVPEDVLATHGAVSPETAAAMLDGLRRVTGCDAGVCVTGIAGPGGGSPDKPVGLVYVGTCVKGKNRVTKQIFPGNRDAVRQRTVIVALDQLRRHINEQGDPAAPAG